jgi:tetratricopeptide (TPR) repeat protein
MPRANASVFLVTYAWCGLAIASGQVRQTESILREQVRSSPASFRTNHALGEFYLQQHNLTAAIPYLEKARQLDPSNYENAYDLALACLQTGATAKSREVIVALLSVKDRGELHNLLGDVEEAEGHVEDAAKQYEIAARMDPTEKHLLDLGSDLLRHRGFEPALKVFVFATQRYPQSPKLRVGLGIAYYSLGQYDDAVETLCRAVDLDPTDTKALDFLGKMHDVSEQFAGEVTKRLAHFVKIYPDNAAANYYYALSLRKGSHASQADAEALLLRAVKLNPAYTEAHYELGLLYEDGGQDAKAIQEFQLAIKARSDFSKAHYRLGRLYQKHGQPALAQKELDAFEALKAKR